MSLNQEHFDTLIQRLEKFAEKQPTAYKFSVALFTLLGYSYIILILVITLALLAALVWLGLNSQPTNARAITGAIQAFVFLLALLWVLLRSLWVSFPPPNGLALRRKDVPGLFAFVNELSSQLQAPRFHHILLTDEFNAGVIQRPRLGLFGWHQNYLIVGLPLMLALSPEQFRAVLAHELGHLSGNHSRFNGWIYRQRITWYQIFQRLKTDDELGMSIFKRFFRWYMPLFNAYSFVLARMNEYEADRCSAQITGVKNVSEALMNFQIKAQFLEKYFWSSIYQRVETEIEPPKTTFTEMKVALLKEIPIADASLFLKQALVAKTNNEDTHPCFKDRLKALGFVVSQEELPLPETVKISGAKKLLGDALGKVIDYFNEDWQVRMATSWRQQYAYIQESLATLKKLDTNAEKQNLTVDEAWSRIKLTFRFKGEDAFLPLLQEFINTNSHHSEANYWLGEILLKQQDATGIEYIEKAMAKNQELVIEGCKIVYYFLNQQGKIDAAQLYRQRAEQHHELTLRAQEERSCLNLKDELQPHNLPTANVKKLCQQLSQYPEVKTVYLVQKVVKYFPEQPVYVLGVMRKISFWGELYSENKDSQLLNTLLKEIQLGDGFIIILNNNQDMDKKMRKVPEALIYSL